MEGNRVYGEQDKIVRGHGVGNPHWGYYMIRRAGDDESREWEKEIANRERAVLVKQSG